MSQDRETRIVSGNEALALGALRAGVKVVTGYPGTPSSGAIGSLLMMDLGDSRHVEWSANEKVALEIAASVSWAGHRALCTMKMSGLNVAYDSLISIAYSGCNGGLVIYVADDPGASAGMAEQDSRGFALMSDLPMLEPSSVSDTYDIIQVAFDLSEQVKTPVFVRLVASIANSHAVVEVETPRPPADREMLLEKDIARYTKAGSTFSMQQHRDVVARLEKAGRIIHQMGLNQLRLADSAGGLGIVASGVTCSYLDEAFKIAAGFGFDPEMVSVLRVKTSNPLPEDEVQTLLGHCGSILVLEELEPHIEHGVTIQAHRAGFQGRIIGKREAFLERLGEYDVTHVVRGIAAALELKLPEDLFLGKLDSEALAAKRPITVCAGCPHRGTFIAINQAIKRLGLKKDDVMVTGDIGCTILGMNPPFDTVWTEISMGASISLAQGYVYAGIQTPVLATIGDSTFFHAGIPGLINAVQHQVPLTLIIMDNGWTGMTGMQTNPGTDEAFQEPGNRRVDIAQLIPALGVEQFFVADPFDLKASREVIMQALKLPGVKVVLSRQECAIQAMRRGIRVGKINVVIEDCNLCQLCVIETGCPAIEIGDAAVVIDPVLCYGCGLCVEVCHRGAIVKEPVA